MLQDFEIAPSVSEYPLMGACVSLEFYNRHVEEFVPMVLG